MIHSCSLVPPRYAFSARHTARAGDVWRLFQEIAVSGSAALGWGPARYKETGVAFIVRTMTVVHHREIRFGESVKARTWVGSFRRGLLSHRESRMTDAEGQPIADTTQEWVHLRDGKPARARPDVLESFVPVDDTPSVELPEWEPVEDAREHRFTFVSRFVDMDPIDHENHPAYVDWADEGISQVLHAAGISPLALVPVAERVRFKLGVEAPAEVTVATRVVGTTDDAVVCTHEITTEAGLAATATTLRCLTEGSEALLHALR